VAGDTFGEGLGGTYDDAVDQSVDDAGAPPGAELARRAGAGATRRFCQVVTTTDSREATTELARSVVAARLGACAQVVGPVASVYWWDGAVQTTEEWQCVVKTTEDAYPALEEHIRRHHPYDVPEIVRTPITAGLADYLDWIAAETTRAEDPNR
jgi:periplasmic divalent cation tolerance protein